VIDSLSLWARRHKSLVIRACVLGALLFAWSVTGIALGATSPVWVLMALLIPAGLLAVVERIELGLVAMLLAGVFVRFRIPTSRQSEIVISLVICTGCIALWIVHMLVVEKRLALKPAPINWPLLAFMATVPFSWLWSRAFRDPLVREVGHPLVSVAAGLVIAILPACALLAANTIRSVRWLQALVWIVLMEGLIVLVVDLGANLGLRPVQALGTFLRTNGVIHVNSHGLLSMWCTSFALALALFNRRLGILLANVLACRVGAGFCRRRGDRVFAVQVAVCRGDRSDRGWSGRVLLEGPISGRIEDQWHNAIGGLSSQLADHEQAPAIWDRAGWLCVLLYELLSFRSDGQS